MRIFKNWFRKEKRSQDASWAALAPHNYSASYVSPRDAESIATVIAAVDLISSSLASLTPKIYSSDGTDRALRGAHALQRLLSKPNAHQGWGDFIQWLMRQVLLHGNGIAVYGNDALIPVPWGNTSISQAESGQLIYEVNVPTLGASPILQKYSQERVLHIRAASDNGLVGISPLARSRATVGLAATINAAAQALWDNGAYPSGLLTVKGKLSVEQRKQARQELKEQFTSSNNYQTPMLVDNETSWQNVSHRAKDNQLVESRDFAVVEVARLFGISPILLGDMRFGTYTNSAEAAKHLHRFTLTPWAKKIETAFSNLLLADNEYLELDQSDFTRGDATDRWANWKIAIETGVLTPEEVKRLEGY